LNPRLARLERYPFERLAMLKAGVVPPAGVPHIAMSIGEPKHAPPAFVLETLTRHLDGLGSYPATARSPDGWTPRRWCCP
jgi:N-succinyldiaminopimelate aminotransferase